MYPRLTQVYIYGKMHIQLLQSHTIVTQLNANKPSTRVTVICSILVSFYLKAHIQRICRQKPITNLEHTVSRASRILLMNSDQAQTHTPHTTTTEASLFRCVVCSYFFFLRCRLFHSFFECVCVYMLPFIIYSFLIWMLFGLHCVYSCRPYVWLTAMAMVCPSQFVHFNTLYRFFISLSLLAIFCICFHCTMRGLVLHVLIGFFFP